MGKNKQDTSSHRAYKLHLLEETLQEGLDPTIVTIRTYVTSLTFDKVDYFNYIQKHHKRFNVIIKHPEGIPVATEAAATTET